MKGNILAVYFFVAKPDMRVSLHGERVEICHLEGPCPILFSFVAHTEEVRVLFLAISFTAIYAPMSLSSAHFLSTRGIFSYFYCAAGQCGSPRMLHCWHFWLIRLSFPQFLPGNSHGNSPASKLCRHQEFIVLLLFRAVYPPWSPAGEEPSLAISAMAGISSAADLSICWTAKKRAFSCPQGRTGLTFYRLPSTPGPSRLVRVLHSTSSSEGEAGGGRAGNVALQKLQLPPFPAWLSHFPGRLGRSKPGGTTGRTFSAKSLLVACCAVKLLLSMNHLLVPVLLSASCLSLLTAKVHSPQQLCPKTSIPFIAPLYHEGSFPPAAPGSPGLKELT